MFIFDAANLIPMLRASNFFSRKMNVLLFALLLCTFISPAQTNDSITIRKIFDQALTKSEAYQNLETLCRDYGKRLSGSPGAEGAVAYTKKVMEQYGFDSVWLQPVMVPHWVRGEMEKAYYVSGKSAKEEMTICALGNSIGTGSKGISAGLVEVTSFEELATLGKKNIQGKIVFFNRPMDPKLISTFSAYGGAVGQRSSGAARAASYGAIGVVVRSMSLSIDDYPHTGAMSYNDTVPKIPACAISTIDAEALSAALKKDPGLQFYFRQTCEMLPDVLSYNVIGEIRGSEFPNEYIIVGGHLDAWDVGDGAHDDGAGCVQSIEVLRIFKEMNIVPKHTIRAVMFMNEENGLRGGKEYAAQAKAKDEKHLFALESDAGGFTPRGFGVDGPQPVREKILQWQPLLEPYGIHQWGTFGGADIGPLKDQGTVLSGLSPDSQRYFDVHHADSDTFEKVNKRELELGAAAMAALIFLVDKYGL